MGRPLSVPPVPRLIHVLQRELEESRIGCVVLEELRSRDLTAVRAVGGDRGIRQCGVIQHVESIGTELEILLAPGCEVLEQ
jgi:hypothetical protein